MGRIFNPFELECEKVPEEGAHAAAAELLIRHFSEDASSDSNPRACQVHNTATEEGVSIRNMLIATVIYHEAHQDRTLGRLSTVVGTAQRHHNVAIEVLPFSLQQAIAGDFQYDTYYLKNLCHTEFNDMTINSPATLLTTTQDPFDVDEYIVRTSIATYLANAQLRLGQALANPNNIGTNAMQFALEIPRNMRGRFAELPGDNVGKAPTLAQRLERTINPEIGAKATRYIDRLMTIDSEYSALLEEVLSHKYSLEKYTGWLERKQREAISIALRICNMASLVVSNTIELPSMPSDEV